MAAGGGGLPVVDLAPFLTGDEVGIARATAAVRDACRTHGFFRAVNHGVPAELLARALELSAAFFALPDEEKAKVRPAAARGLRRPSRSATGGSRRTRPTRTSTWSSLIPSSGSTCTLLSQLHSGKFECKFAKLLKNIRALGPLIISVD
ncbi:hypothetical protein PVAP13_7KG416550 [Panicum virgatum]|uniref:Non-haem dioxygenase N-terminal domain-containing protein n=1 Tax=Panicum virgatum TaxID=38727 RepID=A0A8T0QQ26_PANVG|nr:hypothetical protein PVAP13_7KG416550 [Panicum virgatum]